MDKYNSEWMTCGPWYNTSIFKKLNGKLFEGFIRNARTDRYNIMCPIDAHEKEHPSYCDDGRISGGCTLPSNSTTEAFFFAQCNHIFHRFLAKIIRTQCNRTLSYVCF